MELYKLKLVRESSAEYPQLKPAFTQASDIYSAFKDEMDALDREEFRIVALDNKHVYLGVHTASVGSLTATLVHPREVFKFLILSNCAAFILMHNHPSGNPTPSRDDMEITRRLRECADLFGLRCIDHIIFGRGIYYSFSEEGLM